MMIRVIIIKKTMMIIGSLNDVEDNENVEKANRFSLPNQKKTTTTTLHVD